MARHDWDYYRHRYVTGVESLEQLAALPSAPNVTTLKNRSRSQDWSQQRALFRNQTATSARQAASSTEAEIATRHLKIAQALQAKALQALQAVDPKTLPPSEIRQYLTAAAELERKAAGIEDKIAIRRAGDVSKLTDEELLALAGGSGAG